MKNSEDNGYETCPGFLYEFLQSSKRFNDPYFVNSPHIDDVALSDPESAESLPSVGSQSDIKLPRLTMPTSKYGRRVSYDILEYDPLQDSCNVSTTDWIRLASDIERYYHAYDAFVILHGTDTMAYTTSAVSFLLQDLGKSVIFTGSQIPLSEVRNDAHQNLLGALTIAGHFVVPEVTLFFGTRLWRGNRVSKVDSASFEAFESPNCNWIARVGVEIEVRWERIFRPARVAPFRAFKSLTQEVSVLRLFPGICETVVRAALAEPIRGIILETFGAGNMAANRPELLAAISEATSRGVVIVNITQCRRGGISPLYSTSVGLRNAGVLSGHDMTTECALAKLSFLLANEESRESAVRVLQTSIRGEQRTKHLTAESLIKTNGSKKSLISDAYLSAIAGVEEALRPLMEMKLRPVFLHLAASEGDISALERLFVYNYPLTAAVENTSSFNPFEEKKNQVPRNDLDDENIDFETKGSLNFKTLSEEFVEKDDHQGEFDTDHYENEIGALNIDCLDHEQQTCLQTAVRAGQLETVRWLISKGANVHWRDQWGRSAFFEAFEEYRMHRADPVFKEILHCFRTAGGKLPNCDRHLTSLLMRAAHHGDVELIRALHENHMDISRARTECGKTILHIAYIHRQTQVISFLNSIGKFDSLVTIPDDCGLLPSPPVTMDGNKILKL